MSRVETTVTLRRERGNCSACHTGLTVGVRITAQSSAYHFLFCRRCADRIGLVGRVITDTRRARANRKGA